MTTALATATQAEKLTAAVDDCYTVSALLTLSDATLRNVIEDGPKEALPGLLKVIEVMADKLGNIHETLEKIEMAVGREQAA